MIKDQKLPLIIIASLSFLSMIGSLYFSEVMQLLPCDLCWYQRICMYPIGLLVVISLFIHDNHVKHYIRFLSIVGFVVALYHLYIQYFHQHSSFCRIGSYCGEIQIEFFGFITIPLMSAVAFLFIFVLTFFAAKK
ncbi:disulfide bond formation protein B (plasmid) [Aneurinibacillus sp. Ricciae_BoGa-3]|uniref:disulfide bond formation protein B n=1 Tax=Aneurinibacillus sp. Ricciae_BoGa-3 TaxID=3022697 RepID=UPI002340BC91|nr:disulfide bond formation protein B [Aneurinibacillus sp. Ricciae_BoGa-3]WCK57181.1 disulfide bond formation protein B [Aneurinibacillus sp. Ricciae_BoGa-3]